MRIIRYVKGDSEARYGWVLDDKIGEIDGSPYGEFQREEADIPIDAVKLLAPVTPSKIVCIGRNYAAHVEEHDAQIPESPLVFLKPPSAIIGPGEEILLPPQSNQVEHEAELAVVIGKPGKWIQAEQANEHIFGYTIANDVTARDLQRRDGQWTRGKGFDTFCPVGPWIETEFDPSDAVITCRVNEGIRQFASTRDMVFTVAQLMVFVSSVMKLETGDLLLTGTPAGVGALQNGDSVEIEIEGLGNLKNTVKEERPIKG